MYKKRGQKSTRIEYLYLNIESDTIPNIKGLVKLISKEFEMGEIVNGKKVTSNDLIVVSLIKTLREDYKRYLEECRQECITGGYPLDDGYNIEVIQINAYVRATHSLREKAPKIIKKIKKKKTEA